MTLLVVSHEMGSAFKIADRIAMLDRGTLLAVDSKDRFRKNPHPRIRQFLDRVPDPIAESPNVQKHIRELVGLTGATT